MSSEPDWTLYRTFLAVARLGSFSAAARALGLTQPTAARHIEELEEALGVDLFARSPRGLTATDMAKALLPQAAAIAVRDASLRRVLTEQFSFDLPLWIVMHENLKSSAACRAVFDALATGLAASAR